MHANEYESERRAKDKRQEERMLQQQRHNEELLELLEQQQATLVRNAKDLSEYEKTLVSMSSELDMYRQVSMQEGKICQQLRCV